MKIGEKIQSGDWKAEKHVPVIECPDKVEANKSFSITVSVGKEIPHPNTTEHHIRWIDVYFQPEGDKFVYQVGHFEFSAHGESAKGANQGPAYCGSDAALSLKVTGPGTILAVSLCNIHGLWESSKAIAV
jgi:superoxide reductase